jgi:hypothetical protein
MLTSLVLLWKQHMIVRGLQEHCIAVEILGSSKPVLIPGIQLCPSDPTTPFRLHKRHFPINIAFAITINEAQGHMLKRDCMHHRLFFPPRAAQCDIFPTLCN